LGREFRSEAPDAPLLLGIGPGGEQAAAIAARSLRLDYPLFGDPKSVVFRRFGYRTVLGIIRQSGTVVIDRQGIVRVAHRSSNPVTALPLAAVRAALA
jgi:peroxiredoxin